MTFGILASAHVPPFSPTDVTGLVGWWDASAITGLTDNDPISTWSDLSASSRHVTASGGLRPLYKSSVGGLPAVRFDGTDDVMTGTVLVDTSMTLIAVAAWDAASGTSQYACHNGTAASNGVGLYRASGGQYAGLLGGRTAIVGSSASAGAFVMLAARSQPSVSPRFEFLEGATSKSTYDLANPYTPTGNFRIGGHSSGGYIDGDVREVLMYDNVISNTDLASIASYLTAKWGL